MIECLHDVSIFHPAATNKNTCKSPTNHSPHLHHPPHKLSQKTIILKTKKNSKRKPNFDTIVRAARPRKVAKKREKLSVALVQLFFIVRFIKCW
jgi:hypothetical protein